MIQPHAYTKPAAEGVNLYVMVQDTWLSTAGAVPTISRHDEPTPMVTIALDLVDDILAVLRAAVAALEARAT